MNDLASDLALGRSIDWGGLTGLAGIVVPLDPLAGTGSDTAQQYPAVIRLADLAAGDGFRIDGEHADDNLGFYGTCAGDLDGDGFSDLIVGAAGNDGGGSNRGAAYVVYGKAEAFDPVVPAADLAAGAGFKIVDPLAGQFVDALAGVGDVNGDGLDDVVIGAPGFGPNGSGLGSAYVVFGRAGGFPDVLDLQTLDGVNGFRIDSPEHGDAFGDRLSPAGDVNGDGFADLIVGAEGAQPHGYRSGAAFVVFGRAGGFDATMSTADLDGSNGFRLNGVDINDMAGIGVGAAGDFNGDGIDDLLVGAPRANGSGDRPGLGYVVFGTRDGFPATIELSALDGTDGFRMVGETGFDTTGEWLAGAGDVNGDGLSDIILGARSGGPDDEGVAYVVFGQAGAEPVKRHLADLDGTNGFKLIGAVANGEFGRGATGAGDVNGDGFADLIVGAPTQSADAHLSGAAYVIFGHADGFDPVIDVSTLDGTNGFAIFGASAYDIAGISTSAAGDVNDDGLADIMVGAYGTDFGGAASGSSYIIYGRAPDTAVDRTGTIASQTLVGGEFGDRLAGLGGDDALWGHGGGDKLFGSSGSDTLTGGGGKDLLSGGAGADVFRFIAAADSPGGKQTDVIRDLDASDVIDLSAIDADPGADGDQAFRLVARFHGAAGEVKAHYKAGHDLTVIQADIDGDGHADMTIKLAGDHEGFSAFVL